MCWAPSSFDFEAPPFVGWDSREVCLERDVRSYSNVSAKDTTPGLPRKPDAPPSNVASGRSLVAQKPGAELGIVTDIFVMGVAGGPPDDVSTKTGCIKIGHRHITRSEPP